MRGPWGKVSTIDLNISAGGWWTVRWSPGVEEKAAPGAQEGFGGL